MVYEDLFYPKGVAVIGSATPGKLASVILGRLEEGGCPPPLRGEPEGQGGRQRAGIPVGAGDRRTGEPGRRGFAGGNGEGRAGRLRQGRRQGGGDHHVGVFRGGQSKRGNRRFWTVARRYGIRFVGPNCAGVINTHANLLATLETRPPKGSMAVISQSGAVGGALMAMAGGAGRRRLEVFEFRQWAGLKHDGIPPNGCGMTTRRRSSRCTSSRSGTAGRLWRRFRA